MRTESYVSTRLLLALIVVAGATGGTFGATEADSVADFSGVQGQDGWQYGYVVPSDGPQFIQLPVNGNYSVERGNSWFIDALDAPQRYYTHLNAFGGHPNGLVTSGGKPIEHWAVRRWTSAVSGLVQISGTFGDEATFAASDGVTGQILLDGVEVWSQNTTGESPDVPYATSSFG
jgi:hypothetical protein